MKTLFLVAIILSGCSMMVHEPSEVDGGHDDTSWDSSTGVGDGDDNLDIVDTDSISEDDISKTDSEDSASGVEDETAADSVSDGQTSSEGIETTDSVTESQTVDTQTESALETDSETAIQETDSVDTSCVEDSYKCDDQGQLLQCNEWLEWRMVDMGCMYCDETGRCDYCLEDDCDNVCVDGKPKSRFFNGLPPYCPEGFTCNTKPNGDPYCE